MNSLNSILIEGNLVREPELRTTQRGTPVCTFQIASNRFYKQDSVMEKEVGFFNIESWAKLAEMVGGQGRKGHDVKVVGRLKQERWQDRDGKTQSKVVIVAEHIEFKPEVTKGRSAKEETDSVEVCMETENLVPTF